MSEFTLVIGNKNYSSWSLRAWLWMKQLGLSFDEVPVALYSDAMEAQLKPYFSNNKVPVLIHRGVEVWDSLAILEYLAEYSAQQGLPRDPGARAVMRALCAEMHSSFVALRSELPMNCRRAPAAIALSEACQVDIARIQSLWQYAAEFSDHEDHWLFGSFSLADAMFAPVVLRFNRYAVPLQPHAAAYVERLLSHPAMVEWIAAGSAETTVLEQEER